MLRVEKQLAQEILAWNRICRNLNAYQDRRYGKSKRAQHKAMVETVKGQLKEGGGVRRFLLRGIEKDRAEWYLITTPHIRLQLFRPGRSQSQEFALASGFGLG